MQKYLQGQGEMQKLSAHFLSVGRSGAYIIADKFIYDNYRADITGGFERDGINYTLSIFGGECCDEEIEKHTKDISLTTYDTVIGIGGGKTLDTAKAIAYYLNLAVIIMPTTASSDAPCSRISVIYKQSGLLDRYLILKSNPNLVVTDTAIIAKAPARFLSAGMGDALSTYYEAAACKKSGAAKSSIASEAALDLARQCLATLLKDGKKAYSSALKGQCSPALENVTEAIIYMSGVGFEDGGLAAAHAVAYGLSALPEANSCLHGEKVAFGTLVQLALENASAKELQKITSFCKLVKLPTTLAELGIKQVTDKKLYALAAATLSNSDTMQNMPFAVTQESLIAAIITANNYSKSENRNA